MSIFSRRIIQNALHELAPLVPNGKLLRKKVRMLNAHVASALHREVIADEWEIVVVAGFGRLGRVEHEQTFGEKGGSVVDVHFTGAIFGQEIDFLADVRTVSDVDAIAQNPVDAFFHEVLATARGFGIIGGITLDVDGEVAGKPGKKKARLKVPPADALHNYVVENIEPWLRHLTVHPHAKSEFSRGGEVQFVLRYDPADKPYARGAWMSAEAPYSVTRNPLYNALQRKAEQLRDTGWTGLAGIIVCDGGCAALRDNWTGSIGCEQIIRKFFEIHEEVAFVDVLRLDGHRRPLHDYEIKIAPRLYWNPYSSRSEMDQVTILMERMHSGLPSPKRMPGALRFPGASIDHYHERVIMSGNTVKMSARTLAELLANRLDATRFHTNQPWLSEFVDRALKEGKLLQDARIERVADDDEDWIVFEFDEDAAVAPYKELAR